MSVRSPRLTNKAYLSAIAMTNISKRRFTYKTAVKISWHRCGKKLRHCDPMYSSFQFSSVQFSRRDVRP